MGYSHICDMVHMAFENNIFKSIQIDDFIEFLD